MGVGATSATSADALVTSLAVQATTSPQNDPQPSASDDEFEDVKGDNRLSSSDDDYDALKSDRTTFDAATDFPFAGQLFMSWKEITNAVHCEALRNNKQVSCTTSLSGRKKRFINVCTGWVAKSIPMITTCALTA